MPLAIVVLLLGLTAGIALAEEDPQYIMKAVRRTAPLTIDGRIERAWLTGAKADSFLQRQVFPALDFFHEVHKYFGVRFAGKGVAVFEQGAFQHGVVFDDAVVDQCEPAVAADVRVGVDIVGFAVGCPAGMAHANMATRIFIAGEFDEIGDFTFFLVNVQTAVLQGDACAVIPAVFEPLKAGNKHRIGFFGADIGDNSAHFFIVYKGKQGG